MHGFVSEMTRGVIYTSLNVIVCNISQEHKNKHYMYLFVSVLLIYTVSTSCEMWVIAIYGFTDMSSFLTKQVHLVY